MHIKFEFLPDEGHFPSWLTQEEVDKEINVRFAAGIVEKIIENKVFKDVDRNSTTTIHDDVIIILNAKEFAEKIMELHRQKLSTREFYFQIYDYIKDNNH